ncbi:MAG: hypothetical protein ACNS60_09945 [Candidatus Cyclobacteriaceae bacterium M2_1C_046]
MEEMKNLLVPVTAETESPPVQKLIKLAGGMNCKIHLAGFISNANQQVSQLMKQTVTLMQKVDDTTKQIKESGGEVTSKLYMHAFKRKANEVLTDHNIGVITSSPDTYREIKSDKLETIHLLLNGNSENGQHHDILVLNTVTKDQGKQIALISRIFGDRIYTLSDLSRETAKDIRKYFKKRVDCRLDTRELRDLLIKYDPALIAMKKEEYKNKNKRKKVLQEIDAPLLLY